ncbi:acyltransferase family protein [Pedobacter sp. AW31-3R]|uniref:acyltransferase family protein n=1 Tax=Pedobacter sp. AW31-3R TaxID=3445781 RepID=UPI003FA077F3
MKNQTIPSLNGLRAICILIVIGDHLFLNHFIPRTAINKVLDVILYNGGLGVGVFFVISGFLITSLLIRENERQGSISLRSFYLRRSLRIFPAYYMLMAIYFMLQSAGYLHLSHLHWAAILTYTTQFIKDTPIEITHLWSLSVEEIFYLLWPLLFILFFKRGNLVYLYAAILLFPLLRLINYDYPSFPYSKTILSSGDALLIGCLTAIKYKKISVWVIAHHRLVRLAFPLLAVFLFSEVYVYHLVSQSDQGSAQVFLRKTVLPVLNALCGDKGLLVNILIAFIIVYSINIRNYWYRFLNLKVVNYIGLLSYSLYLWQEIFITPDTYKNFSLPLVLCLIFITANLSYHCIEKPILLLKDKANIMDMLKVKMRLKRAG